MVCSARFARPTLGSCVIMKSCWIGLFSQRNGTPTNIYRPYTRAPRIIKSTGSSS